MNNSTKDSNFIKCSHEYPRISGIYTHVMKCGELDERKRLVLIIPAPDSEVFTVEGQIGHKLDFIRKFVPEDVEIVLIGHSIGAYVLLEVMDQLDTHHVKEGMLLFPTIEKMAESPRGKRLQKFLTSWRWVLIMCAVLLWLVPHRVKDWLIHYIFRKRKTVFKPGVPDCILKSAHSVVDPYCVSNTTYMAALELQQIVDLKKEVVEKNLPRLRFYYGATDHWCPQELYYKMKELFPFHEKIELCPDGHRHAFIIDSSLPMAGKVADWLEDL